MSLYQNHNVKKYLEKLCAQVKCTEIHPALKSEFLNHIEERIDDLLAQGVPREEAICHAVKDLPFISYGGSQLVVQMLVLGMILAVYRLKDIVFIIYQAFLIRAC